MARKSSTANRALHLLRSILNVAVELGYRVDNPAAAVPKLKETPPQPRFLNEDEQKRLAVVIATAPVFLKLSIELALHTAMRAGEIFNLRHDDIDFAAGVIRLRMTKAGEPQTVPITPAVAKILEALLSLRVEGNPYLIPAQRGTGPMAVPYKALRQLLIAAGIEPAGFHIFRKTAATVAVSLPNSDVLTVSKMLRHKSVRTTEIHYLATDQKRLRQVAADLGDLMSRRLQGGDA